MPKTDEDRLPLLAQSDVYPPPGLMRLASYVQKNTKAKVSVYSEGAENIPSYAYQADIVGVSTTSDSHLRALNHLKKAKQYGATTVIGGPNVSALSYQIATNNKFIDYVVKGHGEESLVKIILGIAKQKILYNPVDINSLPLYNFSSFKSPLVIDQKYPVPIINIEGCIKAVKEGRCGFCAIPHKGIKIRSPDKFWEQIRIIHNQTGAKYFFEVGDSFNVGNYPKILAKKRLVELDDIGLHVYISSNNISQINPDFYKEKLGVKSVFIGLESFNPKIQKYIGKSWKKDLTFSILKDFSSKGINVIYTVMLGLPGENKKTIKKNLDGVKRLTDLLEQKKIVLSIFNPIPGSSIYRKLSNNKRVLELYNKNGKDLSKDDIINYPELFLAYASQFCPDLKISKLLKYFDKIKALGDSAEFSPLVHKLRNKFNL